MKQAQSENEMQNRQIDLDASNNSDPCKRQKTDKLLETLQRFYGYTTFRDSQLQVLQEVLQGRDAAVFWATGSGKSICYQLPALHLQKIVIVVTPLISLMQDQVHALNSLSDRDIAIYLGSGQTDSSAEAKALRGDYYIIYLTPEKLVSFVPALERLNAIFPIELFAIDESHCVSEWGHDFRPEFRKIGTALRHTASLSHIPIVALTATAVPRVQQDVVQSLQLRNPFVAISSFDRTNLHIRVIKKVPGGVSVNLQPLVALWNRADIRASQQATIIYAASRAEVEEITSFLQHNLHTIKVEAYHAGLPTPVRHAVHTNFLTGQTTVVVATTAFGMGIDKPDTRRVIHYGPPKTMEEYYQQIGRAGRDGLNAECTMYVSEGGDFDKYSSDFYVGKLSGAALEAAKASTKALKHFALQSEHCRRKLLLDYFVEIPTFGNRCGTCDTCLAVAAYGSDAQRDFGPLGARLLLRVVSALNDQGMTKILDALSGKPLEEYRYQRGVTADSLQHIISQSKAALPKEYPIPYYRELISSMTQKGYLQEKTKSAVVGGGYNTSWTVYCLSMHGQSLLNGTEPIMMPVPQSIRDVELKEEERRQKVLAQLEEKGIKREQLPADEVEKGDGVVIQAYFKWHTYLDTMRRNGREDRLAEVEDLLLKIDAWRSEVAVKHGTSPHSALPEHLLVTIAYTAATLSPGQKLDVTSLSAAGVRSKEVGVLVDVLSTWVDNVQPASSPASHQPKAEAKMVVHKDSLQGIKPWKYAVYKPQKKTGLAVWELSYNRYQNGESLQTIAMSPSNGRQPVQVSTVVSHIMDGVLLGRQVDVVGLAAALPLPTENEWKQLEDAEASTGMDVTGDPNTSGKHGDKFLLYDILRPILGAVTDKPAPERTDEERALVAHYFDVLRWYMTLRRVGFQPTFSSD